MHKLKITNPPNTEAKICKHELDRDRLGRLDGWAAGWLGGWMVAICHSSFVIRHL